MRNVTAGCYADYVKQISALTEQLSSKTSSLATSTAHRAPRQASDSGSLLLPMLNSIGGVELFMTGRLPCRGTGGSVNAIVARSLRDRCVDAPRGPPTPSSTRLKGSSCSHGLCQTFQPPWRTGGGVLRTLRRVTTHGQRGEERKWSLDTRWWGNFAPRLCVTHCV